MDVVLAFTGLLILFCCLLHSYTCFFLHLNYYFFYDRYDQRLFCKRHSSVLCQQQYIAVKYFSMNTEYSRFCSFISVHRLFVLGIFGKISHFIHY